MLKGCESVKEEKRFVEEEEEEVVKMMTNVGIYEFNAKDLIGHGAFAVVYKGRLKSVSCDTQFQISAVWCVYFSQQCTMVPPSTRICLKWNKLRPILNGQFWHAISKNICLNVFGSKQPSEMLVFLFSNSNFS